MTDNSQLPLVVHLRKDYEDFPNHQQVNNNLCRDVPCRRRRVRNWREFAEAIKEEIPNIITIHYRELTFADQRDPERFVNFVHGLIEYVGLSQPEVPAIAIGVDETCNRNFINRLKLVPGIQGIYWADDQLGNERTAAHRALLAGRQNWEINIVKQLPKELPNLIYYKEDHTESVLCTKETVNAFGSTFVNVNTWQQLVKEIESGEDNIVFNLDTIAKPGSTIKDYIKSIKDIVRFIPGHKPLKILVVITPAATQQQVQELKEAGCLGIGLDMKYYPVEQAIDGARAIINNTPYWPEDIISQLPIGNQLPTSIYFRADANTYVTAEMVEQLKQNALCQVRFCTNWNELSHALRDQPHQLVFHIGMLTRLDLTISEIIDSLKTKLKLFEIDIPIGVGIDNTTPLSVVKELKRAGVFGLVPGAADFGPAETVAGLNSMARREPYWPKHIMDQLPGTKPSITKSCNGITLTTRQQEVMDLICNRGLSNKQIAKTLTLSESTVKIHVSAVMKSYGVRNRTQLALSAGQGLKA